MISKEVIMYETSDGEIFRKREKADDHALDLAHKKLDEILNPLVSSGDFTRNDIYKVIVQIIPGKNALVELIGFANSLVVKE